MKKLVFINPRESFVRQIEYNALTINGGNKSLIYFVEGCEYSGTKHRHILSEYSNVEYCAGNELKKVS